MKCAAGNPSCDTPFLCRCGQCVLCGHPWSGCPRIYSLEDVDNLAVQAHGLGELESLAKGVYDKCLKIENKSHELVTNDAERRSLLEDLIADVQFLERAARVEIKSVIA